MKIKYISRAIMIGMAVICMSAPRGIAELNKNQKNEMDRFLAEKQTLKGQGLDLFRTRLIFGLYELENNEYQRQSIQLPIDFGLSKEEKIKIIKNYYMLNSLNLIICKRQHPPREPTFLEDKVLAGYVRDMVLTEMLSNLLEEGIEVNDLKDVLWTVREDPILQVNVCNTQLNQEAFDRATSVYSLDKFILSDEQRANSKNHFFLEEQLLSQKKLVFRHRVASAFLFPGSIKRGGKAWKEHETFFVARGPLKSSKSFYT